MITEAVTEVPITANSTTNQKSAFTLKIETGIPIPSTRNRATAQNPLREQVLAMVPSTLNKENEIVGEPGSSSLVATAGDRNKVVNAVKRYRDDCRIISRQESNGIRLWLVFKVFAPTKTKAAGKTE